MHILRLHKVTLWINFQLQVGTNFASDIVTTILIGLHMSETCSRFSLNKETEKHVVNPITCGDCICPTHNTFGVKFSAQMSCKCGNCSGEYLYTALFHKLDAGSPLTTKVCCMQYIFWLAKLLYVDIWSNSILASRKCWLEVIIVLVQIKSFAELPVLLDEQFCKDKNCEDCGSLLNIDLLLSNAPHFFTIGKVVCLK